MPLDLAPPPKLWTPSKPAIIRASDIPRTYAEALKISHTPDLGSFPFPTFVPAGSANVAVIASAQAKDTTNTNSFSFNAMSLPGSWTHLFITTGNRGSGATNVSSLTANGNACTYQNRRSASTYQTVELWNIALSGSTSVNIAVTFAGTTEGASVGVLAVTGLQSLTGGTVVTDDTNTFAFAPTVAAGGISIACIFGTGASSATWAGDATEFVDSGSFGGNVLFHTAGYSLVSGTPNLTCTATSLSSSPGFAMPFR